jgi:molecular chaperone GrpE
MNPIDNWKFSIVNLQLEDIPPMTRIPIDEPNDDPAAAQPGPDDTPPGVAGAADSNELIQLRGERDQLYERLARATAEFKNTQRRLETEFEQRSAYANQSLLKSLLTPIDSFERALAQDPAKVDAATLLKGLQIIHDQLMAVLRQQKVDPIAPKPGDPFDPTRHEAVMQQPDDRYAEPAVTQLFEKGYALQGRTLRPAKVAVSKMS